MGKGKQEPSAQSVGTLADGREVVRMLCELVPEEAPASEAGDAGPRAPTWIQVCPFGPLVEARDGRAFQITDALALAARTETPLVVDWDHESEWGKTRAAGWIEELRVQEGDGDMPRPGIWGRVDWTAEGRDEVSSRAYRFLSPVVILDSETRDAQQIVSVAMTNRPALRMHGLDHFRERIAHEIGAFAVSGGDKMQGEKRKALCLALGIAPESSDDAIVASVASARHNGEEGRLRELCSTLKSELSDATKRVVDLESKLTEHTRAAFEARVESVLEQAAKDGKITPANADRWRAYCRKGDDALAMFERDILPDLAVKGAPAPKSPESSTASTSTATLKLARLGLTDDEAKKAEEYIATRRAAAGEE